MPQRISQFLNTGIPDTPVPATGVFDAVERRYIDDQIIGTQQYAANLAAVSTFSTWKNAVRGASTSNVALNGALTHDGIAYATGDRFLAKNQSTASQNGIWSVDVDGPWSRAIDADVSTEVTTGMRVWVASGTVNAKREWVLTTAAPIVLGTTNLTFQEAPGVGDKVKLDAATALAEPITLVSRDGAGLSAFTTVMSDVFTLSNSPWTPAASGFIRGGINSVQLAVRNAANSGDIDVITVDASDNIIIGENTDAAKVQVRVKSAGLLEYYINNVLVVSLAGSSGSLVFTAPASCIYTVAGTTYFSSGSGSNTPTFFYRGNGDATLWYNEWKTVQTTTATVTTIDSFTLSDNTTYNVEAWITGDVSSGANSAGYIVMATVKRTGGGAATLVGTANQIHVREDDAAWDATIDVTGNDCRVRVTGVAATTINWKCRMTVMA